LNDSTTNVKYKIFSEFTPNYSLPLTIKNDSNFDLIFNQSMNKIDFLIKDLQNQIEVLKKKE